MHWRSLQTATLNKPAWGVWERHLFCWVHNRQRLTQKDFADMKTKCGSFRFPFTQWPRFVVVGIKIDVISRYGQNLTNWTVKVELSSGNKSGWKSLMWRRESLFKICDVQLIAFFSSRQIHGVISELHVVERIEIWQLYFENYFSNTGKNSIDVALSCNSEGWYCW